MKKRLTDPEPGHTVALESRGRLAGWPRGGRWAKMRASTLVPLGLLVLLQSLPAGSQYLYLDTNQDGVHDQSDQLAPSGTTKVDVWLVTDRSRDGTPAVCNVEVGTGLTMNSYTFVLHAAGGSVEWGPMQNRVPFTERPVCIAIYEDTTGTDYYHNGWAHHDIFPPGKYHLATLPVTVTSGQPTLFFEPYLPRRPVALTQFGTKCLGLDNDNTYKLGSEWHDADGIGPMRAYAGGPYRVQAGRALILYGNASRSSTGHPSTFRWEFGDGSEGLGQITTHVYAVAGDYTVVLTASNETQADTDTTSVHVVAAHAPIASFIAPRSAYVGEPASFDGRTSYDVDGDRLSYAWQFGDGAGADGATVSHVYGVTGEFTVTLAVSDGFDSDTAARRVSVYPIAHPPVAAAGGTYTGLVGRTVIFDGTRSSDPNGDPLTYAWSFGDGKSGSGAITGHAYGAAGTYMARLVVSDGTFTAADIAGVSIAASLPARSFGD